ncbi:MAG: hypothetical protein GY861_29300 [bacterium]|nr:hypothetical protein [bacterium]
MKTKYYHAKIQDDYLEAFLITIGTYHKALYIKEDDNSWVSYINKNISIENNFRISNIERYKEISKEDFFLGVL